MIYEYECKIHGIFEEWQSINDLPLEKCPQCEKDGLESEKPKKLISLSSFQLIGGGWAKEGYSTK